MKEVVTVITTSGLLIANKQVMQLWIGIEIKSYFDAVIGCMTSYCMSARAIRQILALNLKATGPRASANIMMYSQRTHAITYHTDIVVSVIVVPLNL